ncbi:MAG TPA: helix-turn-helix domain-containing protein [Myxococcota bacterium]|nr:helix-turn-helix domain-containing protein [Myxococcota bacterium]HRY96482.1 helix-turn-helix domain-containing protein [Myxococcota bacterium]HSA24064.1 helix-turn-helix domain-containing protein [Myxococcota bacterium]
MKDFREQNYYELLELAPHASQQELEVAYQRARRIFSPGSVVTYALFQPEELALLSRRIEEAYRTLSNLEHRKRYDEELSKLDGTLWEPPPEDAPAPGPSPACPEAAAGPGAAPAPADAAAPHASSPPPKEEPAAPAGVEGLPLFQRPSSQPPADGPAQPGSAPALSEPGGGTAAVEPSAPARVAPEPAAQAHPASLPPAVAPTAPEAPPPAAGAQPGPPPSAAPTQSSAPPAASQPPPAGQCPPPMPELDERTVYDGRLLRQVREARGLDLERLANLTKINIFYLRRMEENDLSQLPAPVYVRGYLRLLARLLKLDADKLIAGFDALAAAKG